MILAITMNPAIDKIYFVDDYRINEVHRPTKVIDSAGGKGLNVARVANIMGEKVAATGFVGGGNGKFIEDEVEKLGICNRFVRISSNSRICINVTDTVHKTCTEVLEPGPIIHPEEEARFLEAFIEMIADVDVITISGSLPQGLTDDFYSRLIEKANSQQKKVVLDSSKEALRHGIHAKPFAIKPNKDEIQSFYDGSLDSIEGLTEALRFFLDLGVTMPMISLGSQGSVIAFENKVFRVQIPSIDVVNTVGSGDAFVAGCAVGLSRGYQVEDILRLATACGSVNAMHQQTGFVTADEVNEFIERVEIVKIGNLD